MIIFKSFYFGGMKLCVSMMQYFKKESCSSYGFSKTLSELRLVQNTQRKMLLHVNGISFDRNTNVLWMASFKEPSSLSVWCFSVSHSNLYPTPFIWLRWFRLSNCPIIRGWIRILVLLKCFTDYVKKETNGQEKVDWNFKMCSSSYVQSNWMHIYQVPAKLKYVLKCSSLKMNRPSSQDGKERERRSRNGTVDHDVTNSPILEILHILNPFLWLNLGIQPQ